MFRYFMLALVATISFRISAQDVIPLYKDPLPGSENWDWSEAISKYSPEDSRFVYNISKPSVTVYSPPYYLKTGTAVVVAPGGGFHFLNWDNEGTKVAKWLNSKGITAFVLKYRVAKSITDDPAKELSLQMADPEMLNNKIAPIVKLAMEDGLAAIEYIRSNAVTYEVNPDQIGMMGFSAGATLTMSVAYNANKNNRPNFIAPIYAYEPAIIGSQLPQKKTPIFLAVAGDDELQIVPHSLSIYKKWFSDGHPAELHVYQKGGHGFGMKEQDLPTDTWHERFGEWLQLHDYHKKLYPNKYEKLYGQEAVAKGKIEGIKKMQNDYAFLERYKTENAEVPPSKSGEQRVVFLGNSITEGWANDNPAFFTDNNFIGRGISAQTSVQLLLRFRQDVINLNPKAVVIHIGTNDVAENTGPFDPDYTMSNIESMAELARANKIKVILATVVPTTQFQWNRKLGDRSDMIVDLNNRIKKYAHDNGISVIDYHTALRNNKNGMDPDIAADGVHPSMKGFKIMEETALPVIRKTLNSQE